MKTKIQTALLCIGFLTYLSADETIMPQKARVLSVSGQAHLLNSYTNNQWLPVSMQSDIVAGTSLLTQEKSQIQISFEPAITATIGPKTSLKYNNLLIDKQSKTIRMKAYLSSGSLLIDIPQFLKFTMLLTVETQFSVAFVNNATFNISIHSDTTILDIYSGSIKLSHKRSGSKTIVYEKCRALLINNKDAIQITALQQQNQEQSPEFENTHPTKKSIAILSIYSQNVTRENLESVSDLVAQEIEQQSNTKVLFLNDVRAMLRTEGMEKLLDCPTDSCISKIGNIIGVDKIVLGNLNKLGTKFLFNLKLIDALYDKIDKRVNISVDNDVGLILNQLPDMIGEMVKPDDALKVQTALQDRTLSVHQTSSDTQNTQKYGSMVWIFPGKFKMGSPVGDGKTDEWPQHEISITGFFIDKYEVTREAFEQTMGYNPSTFKGCTNCPVDNVSFYEAGEFCTKAKKRLPSEAEWEYACRAGSTTAFHFGNSISSSQANFNGKKPYGGASADINRNKPLPIGSFGPNNWNLYDMHGNISEWCNDWYSGDYYAKSPKDNPKGAEKGQYRVVRGGSFENDGIALRSANRLAINPSVKVRSLGFRCVRDYKDVEIQK